MIPFVLTLAPEEQDGRESTIELAGRKTAAFYHCVFEVHAGNQFYNLTLRSYLEGSMGVSPQNDEYWVADFVMKHVKSEPAGENVHSFIGGEELDCLPRVNVLSVRGPNGSVSPVLELVLRGRIKIVYDGIVFTALTRAEERAIKHDANRTKGG